MIFTAISVDKLLNLRLMKILSFWGNFRFIKVKVLDLYLSVAYTTL